MFEYHLFHTWVQMSCINAVFLKLGSSKMWGSAKRWWTLGHCVFCHYLKMVFYMFKGNTSEINRCMTSECSSHWQVLPQE